MRDKKNILWMGAISWLFEDGTYFPRVSYPGIVSGSLFQQSMIEGMESKGYNIQILNDCDMSEGERVDWSHNGKNCDVRVGGKKGLFKRLFSKTINLKKEFKKNKYYLDKEVLIVYEIHLPYLLNVLYLKKKNKNIKVILICPDLSMYSDLSLKKKKIKSFLKKIELFFINNLLKYIDGFVIFTKSMLDYLGKYCKPYQVIEGVYANKFELDDTICEKYKYILYSGSLHHNTGIEELIESFIKLNLKDIKLVFFGSGSLSEYIIKMSEMYDSIVYKGFVEPKALFVYEQKSLCLLNLRNPSEEYTKYSFPSKLFEFMASGTPVITTNLAGIPDEYKQYMIVIENNSFDNIKSAVEKVLNFSTAERRRFGLNAREFVLSKKNKYVQSCKLEKLIEEI